MQNSQKTPPIPACFCNKVADPNPEFLSTRRPQHKCFSVTLVKVLRTLRATTSYSSGRYLKTYLDAILKGSNDINWDNIGDFNANIEHVFVYYDNFGGRHLWLFKCNKIIRRKKYV